MCFGYALLCAALSVVALTRRAYLTYLLPPLYDASVHPSVLVHQVHPIGQVKEWSDFKGACTFDRGVSYFLEKVMQIGEGGWGEGGTHVMHSRGRNTTEGAGGGGGPASVCRCTMYG